MEDKNMSGQESLELIERVMVSNHNRIHPGKSTLLYRLAWIWLGVNLLFAALGWWNVMSEDYIWMLSVGYLPLAGIMYGLVNREAGREEVKSYKDIMITKILCRSFLLMMTGLCFLNLYAWIYYRSGGNRYDIVILCFLGTIMAYMLSMLRDMLEVNIPENRITEGYNKIRERQLGKQGFFLDDVNGIFLSTFIYMVAAHETRYWLVFLLLAFWSCTLFTLARRMKLASRY